MKLPLFFVVILLLSYPASSQFITFFQGGILRGEYAMNDKSFDPGPLKGISFQGGARFGGLKKTGNIGFQAALCYDHLKIGPYKLNYMGLRPGVSYLRGSEASLYFLAGVNATYNLPLSSDYKSYASAGIDVGAGYSGAFLTISLSKAITKINYPLPGVAPGLLVIALRLYPDLIF